MRTAIVLFLSWTAFGQNAFEVASVKPSQQIVGKDYGNQISISPAGFSGRNVTLKRLIEVAYHLAPHQVSGALNWLDVNEYDVDAKVDAPASREQLFLMLRPLLKERFGLSFHHEQKEFRAYELVVDKGSAKIHPLENAEPSVGNAGWPDFRGDMQQFVNLLSVQLAIPVVDDPTTPSRARGTFVPVIDKTGLEGIYHINVDLKAEAGVDMFTLWQRVLQDKLGLKLESRRGNVDVLMVDRAERIPTAN